MKPSDCSGIREDATLRPVAIDVSDELGDKLTGVNELAAADTDNPVDREREEGSPMCPMIMLLGQDDDEEEEQEEGEAVGRTR